MPDEGCRLHRPSPRFLVALIIFERSGNGELSADVNHGPGRFQESGLADVVAGFLFQDCVDDEFAEIGVGGSLAELAVEVVFFVGKEAGADFAVGGEADAATGSAEGLRHGSDDADFAFAICESVSPGGFAGGIGGESDERKDGAEPGDDFAERHDHVGGPETVFSEGHEFDEADDEVFAAGKVAEGLDLIVVETAKQDAVDFDRAEARLLSCADAADNGGEAGRNAGDALEGGLVDGVHADGDAREACALQRLGELLQEMTVGGDGEVEFCSGGGAPGGELLHHFEEIAAQEGFAAGETHLFDAERDEAADDAEVVVGFKFAELGPDLAGAAIDTLIVATVCDGNAQIGDNTAVTVE